MKILQLVQKPQLRGAELFASQLSNHLRDAGHEVKIVCLVPGPANLPFKGETIKLDRPLSRRFFDPQGWRQLADLIKSFQPDVVQANAGDTLKFAVFSKLMFRWKAKLVFRNANKVSDFVNTWPKLVLNKFFVSRLDHVISVSELCRQDFVKTYTFPSGKTTTVPIGIETVDVSLDLPQDLKHIFNRGKVLVNVASLVAEKNQQALIRIAAHLKQHHPGIRIVIIGDGRLRESIQAQITSASLEDVVFLLGYRTDVLTIMSHAHALVLPSLIEGLPGVILEAFYCKLAVIANDVGGISEVVKPRETGWLIKKGDEEAFLQAIVESLASTEKISQMRDQAYEMVIESFTNEAIAKRFTQAYQKLKSA